MPAAPQQLVRQQTQTIAQIHNRVSGPRLHPFPFSSASGAEDLQPVLAGEEKCQGAEICVGDVGGAALGERLGGVFEEAYQVRGSEVRAMAGLERLEG